MALAKQSLSWAAADMSRKHTPNQDTLCLSDTPLGDRVTGRRWPVTDLSDGFARDEGLASGTVFKDGDFPSLVALPQLGERHAGPAGGDRLH
jgi:hypothetical protein